MLDESPEALLKSRMRSFDRRRLLRPYRSGEAIDLALRIYRSIARPVLVASLPTMTLAAAGLLFISTFVLPSLTQTRFENNIGAQLGEAAAGLIVALVVVGPLLVISLGYVTGLCVRLTSNTILGHDLDIEQARKEAPRSAMLMFRTILRGLLRAFVPVLAGVVLLGASALLSSQGGGDIAIQALISLLGLAGILVGGIAFPVLLFQMCLAPPAAILESLSPKEAFQRSKFLVRRPPGQGGVGDFMIHLWFIIFLGLLLLNGGLGMALGFIPIHSWFRGQLWLGPWVEVAVGMVNVLPLVLTVWLLAPLWSTAITVLYYDRRSRLEAYDISILADDVLKAKKSRTPLA